MRTTNDLHQVCDLLRSINQKLDELLKRGIALQFNEKEIARTVQKAIDTGEITIRPLRYFRYDQGPG